MNDSLYCEKALKYLKQSKELVDLIYIDPPFNTGKTQRLHGMSYEDSFKDYRKFITSHIKEAHRLLKPNGSLLFHIRWEESARCRLWMEKIFGHPPLNQIIWAYDYGGRAKRIWSNKHDVIFWFAKDNENYTYNYDDIDRIPYISKEGLVSKEKLEKGKTPTDVWWQSIVGTNSKERTGYPTQKPIEILKRIIAVHSNKGDTVLDFFAGSGTTGEACVKLGRRFILVDQNPQAIEIIRNRINYE